MGSVKEAVEEHSMHQVDLSLFSSMHAWKGLHFRFTTKEPNQIQITYTGPFIGGGVSKKFCLREERQCSWKLPSTRSSRNTSSRALFPPTRRRSLSASHWTLLERCEQWGVKTLPLLSSLNAASLLLPGSQPGGQRNQDP